MISPRSRRLRQDADGSVSYTYNGLSQLTGAVYDDETGVSYSYDALGRKVTREETMWAERQQQPQGNAWGLQKDPGEKAAPATEGKGSGNGKPPAGRGNGKSVESGSQAATEPESSATVEEEEEPVTCPEGTIPVEVNGNPDKPEKGNKAATPLKKTTETTRSRYDSLTNVVANEYGANGQDVAQYYRGQRDIVARKQFGLKGQVNPGHEPTLPMAGGLKYYHPDLRGSVSALTDPKGQTVEQYRYDAFGGLFTGITAPYNTSGLNGHELDPASGLVDMKARWYAPQNGRFLTPDTWRGTQDEPWTQNKFVYAGNNPVTRWDPTGNFSCSLGADCIEDSTWYFFQGSRTGPGDSRMVSSKTDRNGTYREYEEYSTTFYDYHVIYITWIDRDKNLATWTDGNATFASTTWDSYTTFQPHTQDSLNRYTEAYREERTGSMPEEREIIRATVYQEWAWSESDSDWIELVRPAVAGGSSGSQVLSETVAKATGSTQYQVQSGDSLWGIAEKLYGDGKVSQDIAKLNPQLEDPNAIFPGQIVTLPKRPYLPTAVGNDLTAVPDAAAFPGGSDYGTPSQDTYKGPPPTGPCAEGVCYDANLGRTYNGTEDLAAYDAMMLSTLSLMEASQYRDCLEREKAAGRDYLPVGCYAKNPMRFWTDGSGQQQMAGDSMLEQADASLGPFGAGLIVFKGRNVSRDTLKLLDQIDADEAIPSNHTSKPFANDGRGKTALLPKTDASGNPITYTEVYVKPKGQNPGGERLVLGSDGSAYTAPLHYSYWEQIR